MELRPLRVCAGDLPAVASSARESGANQVLDVCAPAFRHYSGLGAAGSESTPARNKNNSS